MKTLVQLNRDAYANSAITSAYKCVSKINTLQRKLEIIGEKEPLSSDVVGNAVNSYRELIAEYNTHMYRALTLRHLPYDNLADMIYINAKGDLFFLSGDDADAQKAIDLDIHKRYEEVERIASLVLDLIGTIRTLHSDIDKAKTLDELNGIKYNNAFNLLAEIEMSYSVLSGGIFWDDTRLEHACQALEQHYESRMTSITDGE